MNVACSSCPAKYAVPDEKVRGKKVRITCKRCGSAIIVDGTAEGVGAPEPAAAEPAPGPAAAKAAPKVERVRHKTMVGGLQASANSAPGAPGGARPPAEGPAKVAAPAAAPSPAAPSPAAAGRVTRTEPALAARSGGAAKAGEPRWTVAVTEDDHRDLTADEVAGLFADKVIDAETYVWRDGMADWLTPFEVPEIAAALSARGLSDADAHDPGRASGSWREPGRWDAPSEADAGSDEVTVAMDGDKARLLVEAASSLTASQTVPPPPGEDEPAGDPTPGLQTSGFTAEAAPYSPAAAPVATNESRSPASPGERLATDNLLDSLPTPAMGGTEPTEGASFSSVALPLVSPKSDAPTAALPDVAPAAPAAPTPTATASAPRAAVTGARAARGDLFSKEAQASREASPRARMPSISPDVAPPPRAKMPSVADEPPRGKLPSVTGEPEPRPRARIASTPPAEPQQGALTGARNESSVLFSLEALAGKPKGAAPKKAEEDLFMGGSASSDDAPPSVANLQNAALFSTMTMAVPDFAAPVAPSAPENPSPASTSTPSAPKESSGGAVWAIVVVALLGAAAAAYFLFLAKPAAGPEPVPPVATSAPAAVDTPPPPAEPTAVPADSAAATGSAAPAASASGTAPVASASGAPSASTAATPGAAAPASPPAAAAPTAAAKPAAPAAPKPPAEPGAAPAEKPAAPAPAEKPAEPGAAAEPAAPEGPPFDREAASAALSSAASAAVAQCSSLEGTHGNGKVTVTFVNSGRATNALVSGDFAGSALGGCVAKVFRGSKIPAFGGEVVKVTKSLQIP